MRESRKSPALSLLSAVVMTGLVVSYFFLPDSSSMHADGMVGTPWLSTLLAIVFLTAIAVSMGLLNYSSFLFTSDTKLLYLPYLIFVLSVPGSMDFGLFQGLECGGISHDRHQVVICIELPQFLFVFVDEDNVLFFPGKKLGQVGPYFSSSGDDYFHNSAFLFTSCL